MDVGCGVRGAGFVSPVINLLVQYPQPAHAFVVTLP